MQKESQKRGPRGPKVSQRSPTSPQTVPKTTPKSVRNRVFFGLGRKCGFVYLSNTESMILKVQGARKVKKIRSKIGPANRHPPNRRFFRFSGSRGGQRDRKGFPKGAPRAPKGTQNGAEMEPESIPEKPESTPEAFWDPRVAKDTKMTSK